MCENRSFVSKNFCILLASLAQGRYFSPAQREISSGGRAQTAAYSSTLAGFKEYTAPVKVR